MSFTEDGFRFPPYTDDELNRIVGSLTSAPRPADELREMVREYAVLYQRQRIAVNLYYRRKATESELLTEIEAIEQVLKMPYLGHAGKRWEAVQVSELLSAESIGGGGIRDDEILWAYPQLAELSRRTLISLMITLRGNLEHADPFASMNRTRPNGQKVPFPGRNYKRPERNYIRNILTFYSSASCLDIADIPIGNNPRSNDFLRFARLCVDPINPKAFSDISIRDHARAVRAESRALRSYSVEGR